MTEESAPLPTSQEELRRIITPGQRSRLLLACAAVVCYGLFWWAGNVFRVPDPGYGASLLRQPGSTVDVIVTGVALWVAVLLGSLIAGSVRFDAGLFTACLGMIALSSRGGAMREVLQYARGPEIYRTFLTELVVLYALVGLGWCIEWALHRSGFLQADRFRDGLADLEHPLREKLMASAVQIIIMAVLMYFLATTDKKNQALAAIAFSAFLGTAVAHLIFPVRPSLFFWIGPLVVGIIGYAMAYQSPGRWMIGEPANPLATPLPLDYASVGPASAILGYWMSRRWKREREAAGA
jgi:hypothetical protein